MGYLKERAAYIRGLADGMQMGDQTPEQRVLRAMLDLLEEMAATVDKNKEELEDWNRQMEEEIDLQNLDESWIRTLHPGYDYEEQADAYVHCPRCGEAFAPNLSAVELKEAQACPHCGHCFLVEAIVEEE